MIYLSNAYIFPAFQIAIFAALIRAFYKDNTKATGFAVVTRTPASMLWLERMAGLAAAVVVTVINKGVFDTKAFADYSAAISIFDYFSIAYLCFYSRWGRNKLIGLKPEETENY
jgi:hypothetical protein